MAGSGRFPAVAVLSALECAPRERRVPGRPDLIQSLPAAPGPDVSRARRDSLHGTGPCRGTIQLLGGGGIHLDRSTGPTIGFARSCLRTSTSQPAPFI